MTLSLPARLFLLYDEAYRQLHRLQVVDDLLLISRGTYKGPARQFADGTLLETGDPIGIIHFNNRYLSRIQARSGNSASSKRAAFAFGAALIRSLEELAQSNHLPDLRVITGITWFKAHGKQIGFEIEALPPGFRQRLLRAHFRLMLRLLFPHLAERENRRLMPHRFWMTSSQLQQLLASRRVHTAERLVKYAQPSI